jgi:hypothetical protein
VRGAAEWSGGHKVDPAKVRVDVQAMKAAGGFSKTLWLQ